MSKIYIHYGSTKFDKEKFNEEIKNEPHWSKPANGAGLWASPINTDFSWKHWCESEQFRECSEDNCFKFKLKDNAKVLTVTKLSDVSNYIIGSIYSGWLDFEKMVVNGYDAIELIHGDNYRELHFSLFNSWDCDSICIFNPKIMEFV